QSGAAIVQNNYSAGDTGQQWILSMVSPGNYKLTNVNSGLVLDATGGKVSDGTPMIQSTPNSNATQKWTVKSMQDGTGFYQILPSSSATASVTPSKGSSPSANCSVVVSSYNYADFQKWALSLAN
ncbi:MAG TPA: RICIN domain-containing protein, partial [Polyangia bacterium]